MQSTPELKGVFKKDVQGTPGSGRKGKGKAVAAAVSDDGEDEENQEGNGKEGKVSTADFIRRLWTMVSWNVPLRDTRTSRSLKALYIVADASFLKGRGIRRRREIPGLERDRG